MVQWSTIAEPNLADRGDVATVDGCLVVRQLLDRTTIASLRQCVRARVLALGWASEVGDRLRAAPGRQLQGAGLDDPDWLLLQAEVQAIPAWQALLDDRGLQHLLDTVMGRGPRAPAGGVVRVQFPGSPQTTPPHQDAAYLPQAERVWQLWTPLWPCGPRDGALAVVPGSHLGGLRPHVADFHGHAVVHVDQGQAWSASDLQPGDALLISALTMHRALPNEGPWLRVSVDLRWRPMPGSSIRE